MTLGEIKELLCGEFLTEETDEVLNHSVSAAYSSDLMSDVLAYTQENAVLITGLNNPQVIRTSEMMDICCVIFIRAKEPSEMMIDLAKESGISVMITEKGMYHSCGILYKEGLLGGTEHGRK